MINFVQTDTDVIAMALSFFWVKIIFIGNRYWHLPIEQRSAIIIHEMAHIRLRHSEIGALAIFFPLLIPFVWRAQEFAADKETFDCGMHEPLIEFLKANPSKGSWSHPSSLERINRLRYHEANRLASVTRQPPGST